MFILLAERRRPHLLVWTILILKVLLLLKAYLPLCLIVCLRLATLLNPQGLHARCEAG